MKRAFRLLHRAEDSLLVAMLGGMVLLASTQILLRTGFDSGIDWADSMLRMMVLWLGMVGASVASRSNKHIRIDLISGLLNRQLNLLLQGTVSLISAAVCILIAWHGARWVRLEYEDQMDGFAGIPAWVFEAIIPIAFMLIGLRYALATLRIGIYFVRRQCLHLGLRAPRGEIRS
jgi:TRAP-type C4-dicarboxylate transport system permease small subunit